MRINSRDVLEELGYSYIHFREEGVEPEVVDIRFKDLIAELKELPIGDARLYKHQYESIKALEEGRNLVLVAGTGSGKTEAWLLYVLMAAKKGKMIRTLAVYPTLALANDQLKRIKAYSERIGLRVLAIDAQRRTELEKQLSRSKLRELIASSNIIVTNPAYLLHEVKRLVENPYKPLLESVMRNLDLLVIDELDFYGPRGLALLDAMVELLNKYRGGGLQVVVLTATLANPEDLAKRLREVTGRDTIIISGKPFRVENRVYLVLGKNLREVFEKARLLAQKHWSSLDEDIRKALEDYEIFKRNVYRVVAYLQALGLKVPSPGMDAAEIIARYIDDDGVTLVFTRSIAAAEQLAHRLRDRLKGRENLVATHHHLVPKKRREEIEEAARKGEVKIIISPRTLSQGVDIGTVVRVVHLGLPEDLREFLQREGRKGRRREIGYTETIVIPASRWDHELLSRGLDAVREWLNMPLEKTIVNPRNKYKLLFIGLAKLISPWLRVEKLTPDEEKVLIEVGVIRYGKVDEKTLKSIWERIGFYEYGPPYGIKRYIETEKGLEPLEPIGFCDLVERFQVGCIDYSSEAIVTRLQRGTRSRIVTAVVEKPLKSFRPWEVEGLEEAFEEYKYVKTSWGEEPNILRDIARAKLVSRVVALVYPPRRGFGLLRKIPNRVLWILYSDKPRLVETKSGHIVTYERRSIYVPVNTAGEYRDYTYGIIVEASESDDATLLRLGLAYLTIVLRRVFGIEFETIMYSVEKLGNRKIIELHEPESAGLLETIDWVKVRKAVEEYQPSKLDELLLMMIDELAYSDFITLKMDWELIKTGALRVIDIILSRDMIEALIGNRPVRIPRPSRAQKLLALDIVAERIEETSEVIPEALVALSVFDGEEVKAVSKTYLKLPLAKPPEELRRLEIWIEEQLYYEDFKLLVYDKNASIEAACEAGLRRLEELLKDAIEVKKQLPQVGLPEDAPLEHLLESLKVEGTEYMEPPRLEEVLAELAKQGKPTRRVEEKLLDYTSKRCRGLYILYLALRELAKTNPR